MSKNNNKKVLTEEVIDGIVLKLSVKAANGPRKVNSVKTNRRS
jgi:hypothetical protein